MISTEQKEALEAKLDPEHVAQRSQAGMKLDYIEAWWAISEANRIFGFDGWSRETVELRCVREAELVDGKWRVGYIAKVRVTALGAMREGTGFGSGIAKDMGDAYESAVKEAESDAMKRALMTFGNPFGLALYDKSRENVGPPPRSAASLKRTDANGDDAWDRMMKQLHAELLDVQNHHQLDKLKQAYREIVTEERWPSQWKQALADEFAKKSKTLAEENAMMAG